MRTELRRTDAGAAFALLELDEDERRAATGLMFVAEGDALVRPVDADAGNLDAVYARFSRLAPAMIGQALRREPIPWEDALELVLARAYDLDWWLTGSAALALRGVSVAPRDVDLVATTDGARALAERLADHLVEPLSWSDDWVAGVFGRAFGPTRIEWVGRVRAWVDDPEPTDLGPYAAAHVEPVQWRGHAIRVPPLRLQLDSARRRGLLGRVAAIERAGAREL